MAAAELGQHRHHEGEPSYFIGRAIPQGERQRLWQEPIPPLSDGLITPEFTPNAEHVLQRRYLKKEEDRIAETPQEMLWRVAHAVAQAERLYAKGEKGEKLAAEQRQKFYEMMAKLQFLPNSPTLMNAHRPLGQLSACFVIPVKDSIEDIFNAIKLGALVHKSGGGTGYSFSRLRERGAEVKSTGREASGPVEFMRVFDVATEAVKQGGTRRGANMGVLRVDHPDIWEFIKAKDEEGAVENFNLSVVVPNKFMEAVQNGEKYPLISPLGNKVDELKAEEVFNLIVERAWARGDPGIMFIDRINEANPTPHLGEIEGTNPCGEQPLLPFESCNLGSINLGGFVVDGEVDWSSLRETVHTAVRFLDNVVDVNKYPIEEIEEMTLGNRKIGLGIMGLADMLVLLRLPYDSEEAREKAEEVMKFVWTEGHQASMELAQKRGTFPNFKGSIYDQEGKPIRNATVTTIAPTGSISVITGCSGGCEPLFALSFERRHRLGETKEDNILFETNPLFLKMAKEAGLNQKTINAIIENGRINETDEVPDQMRGVFATSHQISLEGHLKMQAVLQKGGVDNAVSKTINLPNQATVEDVRRAYLLAYQLGCKGVTVYRDGSREEQVFYAGKEKGEVEQLQIKEGMLIVENAIEQPPVLEILHAGKFAVKTGAGRLHVIMSDELMWDEETGLCYWIPKECFESIQPIGSERNIEVQQSGLEKSYILQSEDPPYVKLIRNLKSVKGDNPIGFGEIRVNSISHAVGIIWEYHFLRHGIVGYDERGNLVQLIRKKDLKPAPEEMLEGIYSSPDRGGNLVNNEKLVVRVRDNIDGGGPKYCQECGTKLRFQEGCVNCPGCGFSICN